jgi:hypothetical protein
MRRLLALVTLAATTAACAAEPEPLPPTRQAPPQRAQLGWEESYGDAGSRFIFRVRSFEVLADGWQATISVTNDTSVRYSVGDPRATLGRAFGLMLFETGELDEVEKRSSRRELPSIRRAREYRPALPLVMKPGQTWTGVIAAPGSLAAGRWVRIVFGAFVPIGEPPKGLPGTLVWITDHARLLRADASSKARPTP